MEELQSFRSRPGLQVWYKAYLHLKSYEKVIFFLVRNHFQKRVMSSPTPANKFLGACDIITHTYQNFLNFVSILTYVF
jgi:hypothetical protein